MGVTLRPVVISPFVKPIRGAQPTEVKLSRTLRMNPADGRYAEPSGMLPPVLVVASGNPFVDFEVSMWTVWMCVTVS